MLQTNLELSPVFSAAIVGFIGSFYHLNSIVDKKNIHAIIYAGSFAGMCSTQYLSGHQYVLFISIIGTAIYLLTRNHLQGFGGRLGVIALLSSLVLFISRRLW